MSDDFVVGDIVRIDRKPQEHERGAWVLGGMEHVVGQKGIVLKIVNGHALVEGDEFLCWIPLCVLKNEETVIVRKSELRQLRTKLESLEFAVRGLLTEVGNILMTRK